MWLPAPCGSIVERVRFHPACGSVLISAQVLRQRAIRGEEPSPVHLTLHSDYALRILMYLTVRNTGPVTIKDISTAYGISQHHVTKVAHRLVQYQLITSIRGRRGGLRLAQPPDQISLGEVVRRTEASFHIAECFNEATNTCPITPACGLRPILGKARDAFLAVLDETTLADLIVQERHLLRLLGSPRAG